jgi:hypothetical protein
MVDGGSLAISFSEEEGFVEGRDLSDEALTQTYRTQWESMPGRSSIIA